MKRLKNKDLVNNVEKEILPKGLFKYIGDNYDKELSNLDDVLESARLLIQADLSNDDLLSIVKTYIKKANEPIQDEYSYHQESNRDLTLQDKYQAARLILKFNGVKNVPFL